MACYPSGGTSSLTPQIRERFGGSPGQGILTRVSRPGLFNLLRQAKTRVKQPQVRSLATNSGPVRYREAHSLRDPRSAAVGAAFFLMQFCACAGLLARVSHVTQRSVCHSASPSARRGPRPRMPHRFSRSPLQTRRPAPPFPCTYAHNGTLLSIKERNPAVCINETGEHYAK